MIKMQKQTVNPQLFLIIFLLCSTLISGCASKQSKGAPTPTPIPTMIIPTKPTYAVQRGEVINQIEFSGRVVPVVQQDLTFRTSGSVRKIFVKKDDIVKEGQLLAELDTGPSEFDIHRAQVNLEIEQLKLQLVMLQTPANSEINSLTVAIQQRQVELAQINVDELNNAVAVGQIVSPLNGTVMMVMMAEGNTIEAFKPVIIVADLSKLEVSGELTDAQLSKLSENISASINLVGRQSAAVEGTIRSLPYPYGSGNDSSSQTLRISFMSDPMTAGYNLGDLVNVTIVLEKKENVLWLPPQAIRNFEGRRFVIVQDGDAQRRVDVQVGIETSDRVEIVDGLNEGDLVIAP
jgi:membrane fusion protein, macrolide-specific efflux system